MTLTTTVVSIEDSTGFLKPMLWQAVIQHGDHGIWTMACCTVWPNGCCLVDQVVVLGWQTFDYDAKNVDLPERKEVEWPHLPCMVWQSYCLGEVKSVVDLLQLALLIQLISCNQTNSNDSVYKLSTFSRMSTCSFYMDTNDVCICVLVCIQLLI